MLHTPSMAAADSLRSQWAMHSVEDPYPIDGSMLFILQDLRLTGGWVLSVAAVINSLSRSRCFMVKSTC